MRDDSESYHKIRIFLACPSDVEEERDAAQRAINELNDSAAEELHFILELWGYDKAWPSAGTPQKTIFDQFPPEKWDIFVGILWTRFGSSPGIVDKKTQKPFLSGTEAEFTKAYRLWDKSQKPEILFYRCIRDVPHHLIDPEQLNYVQKFFKECEAGGKHPALFHSYTTKEEFETAFRKRLTALLFDFSKEKQKDTFIPEVAQAIDKSEKPEEEPPPPPHIPFTNRTDELEQVLSAFAPAYHVIDAPGGYGKTELLKELDHRFKEKKWQSAYLPVRYFMSISELTKELANILDVSFNPSSDAASELGWEFGEAIRETYSSQFGTADQQNKGLIFLIDIDRQTLESFTLVFQELLTDFFPGISNNLQSLAFFKAEHNPFRVVIAGRALIKRMPESKLPGKLKITRLKPFDYRVVRSSALAYLGEDTKEIDQLAAHLLFHTGGHPGCMARVLERYKKESHSPDDFFEYLRKEIWDEIVWPEAKAVRNVIPRYLRRIVDDLSVFRYLDYPILRKLLEDTKFAQAKDEYDLADILTRSYLSTWQNRLLTDDIFRRLLGLRLLRGVGPDIFAGHCLRAQKKCTDYLRKAKTQHPEVWATEYLFQAMQQHAGEIHKQTTRQQLHVDFFKNTVPRALNLLTRNRIAREEHQALVRHLDSDWEFQFITNYFLRDTYFTNEPFRKLKQQIDAFFQ